MFYIPVILGTVRRNRESSKIAKFVVGCLQELDCVKTELLDLKEMDLPMMEERLRFRDDAPASATTFSATIQRADAIVIVAPEYSGGSSPVRETTLSGPNDRIARQPVPPVPSGSSR